MTNWLFLNIMQLGFDFFDSWYVQVTPIADLQAVGHEAMSREGSAGKESQSRLLAAATCG